MPTFAPFLHGYIHRHGVWMPLGFLRNQKWQNKFSSKRNFSSPHFCHYSSEKLFNSSESKRSLIKCKREFESKQTKKKYNGSELCPGVWGMYCRTFYYLWDIHSTDLAPGGQPLVQSDLRGHKGATLEPQNESPNWPP